MNAALYLRYFERPWLLLLVVALPLLLGLLVRRADRRRRLRLTRLAEAPLLARLGGPPPAPPARGRVARLGLAGALAAVALAGPRWGTESAMASGEGVDVVLALDASMSMLAEDERPSRLERMKQEVRRLRALSPNDRFALLAFAGRSYILSPLTVDDGAIELFLDNLDPSVVGQGGSSIARTMRQGTELLDAVEGGGGRALVVMSDGESWDTTDELVEAARAARDAGVTVVTVGFGTPEGSTIPVQEGGRMTEKRDEVGQVVVTRYDPAALERAAQESGGRFIAANVTDKAGRVRAALERLETRARRAEEGRYLTPRFQLFLLPAVVLLFLDTLLADRASGRRRPRRRRAAASTVAAAMLLSLLPAPARADVVTDAHRAFEAREYARAIALYRRAIAEGRDTPQVLYNLGTALLAADSLAEAATVLERVATSLPVADPAPDAVDLRHRAQFNLGLARLRQGLGAPGPEGQQALDAALATYKQVLLAHPDDQDARWNYELALREQEEQSGGGGGGGGSGGGGSEQDEQSDEGGEEERQGGLGRQQAEQLLNSAAREERAVQGRRQRQTSQEPPPRGKDW